MSGAGPSPLSEMMPLSRCQRIAQVTKRSLLLMVQT